MGADGTDRHELSAATRVVGVMGYPVAHSLSPRLHNAAFAELGLDWVSVGFAVPRAGRPPALAGARALGIAGLSVTMPHKEDVAAAVDSCSAGGRPARSGQLRGRRRRRMARGQHRRCRPAGRTRPQPGLRPRRGPLPGGGGRRGGPGRDRRPGRRRRRGGGGRQPHRRPCRGRRRAWPGRPVGRAPSTTRRGATWWSTPPRRAWATWPDGPTAWPVDPDRLGPDQLVVDLVYHPAVTPWLAAAARPGGARRPTAWGCWCTRPPSRSSGGRAGRRRWRPCGRR